MLRKIMPIAALLALAVVGPTSAADHAESPGADADPAADLADVFVFLSPENPRRMVAAITFGGRPLPRSRIDTTVYCDPNVIYELNVGRADATGAFSNTAAVKVVARFGDSTPISGRCGVQLENVPGAGGTFSGATETMIASPSGLRAYSGVRNDPFFFDAEGYNGMIAAFANPAPAGGYVASSFGLGTRARRDSFANRNVTVIVFEMDIDTLAPLVNGSRPKLQFWATTARKFG